MKHAPHALLVLLSACSWSIVRAQTPEFISAEAARPILQAMHASLPVELKSGPAELESGPTIETAAWDRWVRQQDRSIRERVTAGEELTLANLLRLGITYTKERRVEFADLARYGHDPAINAIVDHRATELIRALSAAHPAQGLIEMRGILEQNGYTLDTPEAQKKTRAHLLALLVQQRDDVARENAAAKVDPYQSFKNRGLSTDSDLYTAYALDLTFQDLAKRGLLKPASLHRIAIIGPGLDYVNKKSGYDFYPPQVIQPYAVIDSLIRLGLANAASIEVTTFDISARVNQHLERAKQRASAGTPYTLQLLWSRSTGGSTSFLLDFGAYWRAMGANIGAPAAPIPVPESAQGDITTRALAVRPAIAAHVTPVDMNVIFQAVRLPADRRFDLAIGTNIFLYYDDFEQALARANLSEMMKPGGVLISNTPLPAGGASKLGDPVRTAIPIRAGFADYVYAYPRRP